MKNYAQYFAISQADRDWGLYILDCGSRIIDNNRQDEDAFVHPEEYQFSWNQGRILHEFQIIYLVEGSGLFENSYLRNLPISSGSIITLHPEVWHRYKAEEGSVWNAYWIGFGGSMASHLLDNLRLDIKNPIKKIGFQRNIIEAFVNVINLSKLEFSGYQQVFAGDLMKIFGWIYASDRRLEFTDLNIDKIIQKSKVLLMDNMNYNSLEEVAEELNLGYSKFRKVFREYTGMAPGEFQMQHKIRKAINLLTTKQDSIKEIAYELGFESPQYFNRIFKKKTGRTPGNYRKQL